MARYAKKELESTDKFKGDLNKKPYGLSVLSATACKDAVWLLLFQGNFGHNLYRYNRVLISTFFILVSHLGCQDDAPVENESRTEELYL